MKKKFRLYRRLCRMELCRLFCGWKLYASAALYTALGFAAVRSVGSASSYIGLQYISGLSNLNKLLVLTAAAPFAAGYYDDVKHGYIHSVVYRSDRKCYVLSKLTVCVISSFFISAVGLGSYALIEGLLHGMGVKQHMFPESNALFYDVGSRFPLMVIVLQISLFSMVSCAYAVMGMTLSSAVPGRFAAVTGTLLMNVVMEPITGYLPEALRLFNIQNGVTSLYYSHGSGIMFLMSVTAIAAYICLFGNIFSFFVRKEVKQ